MLVLSSLSFVPFHVLFVLFSLPVSLMLVLCPSLFALFSVYSQSVCFSSPYFVVIVSCPACIMFSFASCVSSVTSEHKLIFRTTRRALGVPVNIMVLHLLPHLYHNHCSCGIVTSPLSLSGSMIPHCSLKHLLHRLHKFLLRGGNGFSLSAILSSARGSFSA